MSLPPTGSRPPGHSPSVTVIRPAGATTAGRIPPARSSAKRRGARTDLYVKIVGALVLATTVLSLFDMVRLVSLMAGGD